LWEIVLDFLRTTVVPILTAILTVWLVHRYELGKVKSEQDEKLVGQLFERYVNALVETYEAMAICYDALNFGLNIPPKTQADFDSQVKTVRDKWDRAEQDNALWLANIEKEISIVRGEFKLATNAIYAAIGKTATTFNRWKELSDAYYAARSVLRNLIPISALEKKLASISSSK